MLELVSGSDLRGFIVSHRHARGTGTAAVLGAAGNRGNRSGNSTHSGGGVSERRATGISLQVRENPSSQVGISRDICAVMDY